MSIYKSVNVVDINNYAKLVNKYNATPISQRDDYRDIKAFDNPTLFSADDDGDNITEFVLEIVPEWTNDSDEIGSDADEDRELADEYYGEIEDTNAPDDIYKQEVHMLVTEYNTNEGYSQSMSYAEFQDAVSKDYDVDCYQDLTVKIN